MTPSRPARRRWRPSIRLRLALWSTVGVLVALVVLGAAMAAELEAGLHDRAHESLEVPFRVVEHQLAVQPDLRIGDLLEVSPGGERSDEVIGQLLDADGKVVDHSDDLAATRPMVSTDVLAEALREGEWHEPRRLPGRAHDDIVVVVPVTSGARAGSFVVLAQSLAQVEGEIARLRDEFLLLVPVVLLASFAGGWLIARASLRPVDSLTRQAGLIDPETTDTVLPVPDGDDEITRLAVALNDMLARLRHEIDRERQFSANASHELRTPLALMTTELDVSLRSDATPDVARPVLESVREDVARLSRVVDDLMVLSRVETGGAVRLSLQDHDLLDLAVQVVSRFRTRAAQCGVSLGVDGSPVIVAADGRLLGQALANLVDNALKFSEPAGRVEVTVEAGQDGRGPSVSVRDDGPGIPPDALDRVFDRFFQVERARTTGGSGLGLAIVRSVVAAHGGTVDVQSEMGRGSRFTIHLPPTSADDGDL